MKLLLILTSDETYKLLSQYIRPLGFEFICYRYVLKAMDNIDEVNPHAIIISARDFPRHWKTLVQYIRSDRSRETCPIIILKGENFPLEEISQAFYLGVSGIISENLDNAAEIDRLQNVLSRYVPVEEKRRSRRYYVEPWNRFAFLFLSPSGKTMVTGELKTISTTGVSFFPDRPSLMRDIFLHMEIPECSLRAGDRILSPVCRLARTGRIIALEFLSFPQGEQVILSDYLEQLPLMELKVKGRITD